MGPVNRRGFLQRLAAIVAAPVVVPSMVEPLLELPLEVEAGSRIIVPRGTSSIVDGFVFGVGLTVIEDRWCPPDRCFILGPTEPDFSLRETA